MTQELVRTTSGVSRLTYPAKFSPKTIRYNGVPFSYNDDLVKCGTPQLAKMELKDVTVVQQSLDARMPSLSLIRKVDGVDYVLSYIKAWVIDLQMSLNIKNKLSESMINMFAQTILDDFWYLTISDLKIIFTDAKNGVYGEFYESLSIHKMVKWFSDYSELRFAVAESTSKSTQKYLNHASGGFRVDWNKMEETHKKYESGNRHRRS